MQKSFDRAAESLYSQRARNGAMARPGRLAVLLLAMMFAAALVTAQNEPTESYQNGKTYLSGGTYRREVTLTKEKSPYLVYGTITVEDGNILTIEPGVSVEFSGVTAFDVNGTLIARGDPVNQIRLTATNIPSGWYGHGLRLTLDKKGANSIVEHVVLNQIGIAICQDGVTVRSSQVNGMAAWESSIASREWCNADDLQITGNAITGGSIEAFRSTGIMLEDATRSVVADNIIVGPGKIGIDIRAFRRDASDLTIERNVVAGKRTEGYYGSEGIGILTQPHSNGNFRLINVVIRNNYLGDNSFNMEFAGNASTGIPIVYWNSFSDDSVTHVYLESNIKTSTEVNLTNNYWATTNIPLIRGKIHDGNQDTRLPIVQLEPVLNAPHPDTPTSVGTPPACTDDCASGSRECSGAGYRTCGSFDDESCLDWSSVTACATGEQCASGVCGAPPPVAPPPPPVPAPNATCADECLSAALSCSGSGVIFCGNFDDDTCLEWSVTAPCAEGQVCDAGVCVTQPPPDIRPCVDDCAPGPKVCWRNGFRGCANFDDDPCLEWSEVTNCPRDQRCANGVCAPLPPPEERCVTICHLTSSHPESICVAPDALQAHHDHGDYLGECVQPDEKERDREIRNIIERLEARRPKEIPILRPDMPIEKITIEVDEEFTRVEFVFRNTERPPQDVPAPERKVRRYIEIEHPEIGNEKVTSAKLDFKVERTWLQEQGASLGDVVLTRFKDGAWQDLPTRNVRSDANYEYFEADSVGLSVFAITVRAQEPTAEPAQEIPVQPPVSLLSLTSQTSLIGIAAFVLAGGALGAMLLSRMQRRAPGKAASPALAQYVQSCREKGFSEERIRDTLLKAGWDASLVREAMK